MIQIPRLDSFTLHRLFRSDSLELFVTIGKLSLLAVSAIFVSATAYAAIASFTSLQTAVDSARNKKAELMAISQAAASKTVQTTDYTHLKKKSIFGEIGVKNTQPELAAAPKAASNLALSLIGTYMEHNSSPYAIIEDTKKKEQEVFMLEESIFGEATLSKILADRVEIKRNGQIEVLKLDDTPDIASTASGAASGEAVTVAEQELNQALDNLPLLLTQARAVPYFKDGRSVGLRLFAIKGGSLYEKIGLKNGDILKSINGNDLGDITQAVKLFEKLKVERSIDLTLERNRQEQNIRYEIR